MNFPNQFGSNEDNKISNFKDIKFSSLLNIFNVQGSRRGNGREIKDKKEIYQFDLPNSKPDSFRSWKLNKVGKYLKIRIY